MEQSDLALEVIKLFSCSTQLSMKHLESQLFPGSNKPRTLFFWLINVKMPASVGILMFLSRKNFMLSRVEQEIFL